MEYPENTLVIFEKAAGIKGITGIELDVQLTKDGELVVFHDEALDRVTNGTGKLCDHTLEELKQLRIFDKETIPTFSEVLELLKPYCINNGLLINVELKTSVIRYDGIEEKTIKLVKDYGLENYIVYSSFLPESVALVKQLSPESECGMLGVNASECFIKMNEIGADAIHPANIGIDLEAEFLSNNNLVVRAWNSSEPLYGSGKLLKEKDLTRFGRVGVTDIITNVPERYLL